MKPTKNELNLKHITNKDFDSLLRTNQRYINTIAYSFGINDAEVINDLIQVGRIGLFNAYQNFDIKKSPVFIGYASWYIKAEMLTFLNENLNTIKITHRTRELLKSEQIPATRTISMQHPINDSGGIIEDLIANPVDSTEDDLEGLKTAVLKLKSEQQYLINLCYGLNGDVPVKQKDIAVMFGCSHQNIHDKINKAIAALKKIMINK
ncbi:sigma-70 family RNA polymerase sigma factor [Flavobacterium sp. Sr18]|uniref:sigma-70 family RNA polymerase sigma factor n=1 Tax=Flavobacterium sp. Sr18 TaxID=935222 RepID=UPI0013E4799E|nr:sigma-70 family RNA polymerase sigma factor [Flavobacterium sp. Sr18]QIH37872.1 sigma-70 family RNA polymerase sigma factor [Flavobacterium sp. Sr18]